MKKKQAVAFLLSTTMAVGGAVQAFGASSDISGHWAQATITKWQDAGRIGGYEDGTFKPDRTITRAEFVRLLNSATSTSFTSSASVNFSDVKESDWFYADVAKAVGAKITSGFEDGTFRPSETVTRMQAAVFICNAKGLAANEAGANLLTDAAQIPAWAKGAVGAVISAGYMSGYPDGSFGGAKGMTRAEAVSTLDRVLGGGVTTPAPDNQGVSTPDTNQDTTIADAKQEGNMVWRSGGGGGGSSSKKNENEDKKHDDEDVKIASAADAREHKGHTLNGTTTIELTENLELNDITFNGPVKIISKEASSATAAAYIGSDAVVAAANSRIADDKFTIKLTNGTKFIESVTVEEGVTNAKPVEIFTETTEEAEKTISTLIAKIATRIVGFTTTTVEAHASIEIANGSAGTVTAKEKGAAITVEEGATVTTVEVPVDATVTVQGTVDNVAISKEADATVALEGAANVKELTVEGTAKATIAVAEGTEVGKIKITSENKEPATITGDGNAIKEITAKDPAAVDVSGTKNPPEVKPIEGEEDILVTGIEVTADSKEVEIGGELQLKANVTPSNATNKGVTWSITLDASLKEGDVAISTDGLLTVTDAAVENAKITVTATAVDGSNAKGEYEVTVVKKATTGTPKIETTTPEVTLNGQQQTVNFTATGFAKDATIAWSVTGLDGLIIKDGILTIPAATTVAEDTTVTVKATAGEEIATTTITIKPAPKTDADKAKEAVAQLTIIAAAEITKTEAEALIKTEAEKALVAAGLTGWTATPTITTTLDGDVIGTTKTLEVGYELKESADAEAVTTTGTVTVAASAEEADAITALATVTAVEFEAGTTVTAALIKDKVEELAQAAIAAVDSLSGYTVTATITGFTDGTTELPADVTVTYTLTGDKAIADITGTVNVSVVELEEVSLENAEITGPTFTQGTGDTAGKDATITVTGASAITDTNLETVFVPEGQQTEPTGLTSEVSSAAGVLTVKFKTTDATEAGTYKYTVTIPKTAITAADGYTVPANDLVATITVTVDDGQNQEISLESAEITGPTFTQGTGDTAGKDATITVTGASAITDTNLETVFVPEGQQTEPTGLTSEVSSAAGVITVKFKTTDATEAGTYKYTVTIPKTAITAADGYTVPANDLVATITVTVDDSQNQEISLESAEITGPTFTQGTGDTAGKDATITVTGASAITDTNLETVFVPEGQQTEPTGLTSEISSAAGVITVKFKTTDATEAGTYKYTITIPKTAITAADGYTVPTNDLVATITVTVDGGSNG